MTVLKKVSSKENQIYKLCEKLRQKKYRDRSCAYIVEGENLVEEAIDTGQDIRHIVINEDAEISTRLMRKAEDCGGAVFMKGSLFIKAAQTETSQGILAVVSKRFGPEDDPVKSFLETADSRGSDLVILDRLQDPGNLGTIIRTADAAGYGGIIAVRGTGDIYSPKVVRAAAGSLFRVPVIYAESGKKAAQMAKNCGKKVICTSFDTENMYYDTDLKEDAAIVIGNEGNGVSRELMDEADEFVRIPMRGEIDSLNAAVAAAILMYQSVQQKARR